MHRGFVGASHARVKGLQLSYRCANIAGMARAYGVKVLTHIGALYRMVVRSGTGPR